MKLYNKKLLPATVLALFCLLAFAQKKPPYTGTKTPYPQPAKTLTPPPPGFEPVFINHVGRHGSRFMTKAGSDVALQQLLAAAAQENGLSSTGQRLKAMTDRFLRIEKGQYENITLLGKDELTGIGQRVRAQYAPVFKGKGIDVLTTFKVRTQQSAHAFLDGLGTYAGRVKLEIVPDSLDKSLRFYDLSPAYQAYTESPALEQMFDSLDRDPRTGKIAQQVCKRVFRGAFRDKLLKEGFPLEVKGKPVTENALTVTDHLYELYAIQFSITGEMQQKGYVRDSLDFGIAFRPAELQWLSFRDDAHDFMEKGPARDPLGIQVKIAAPLLVDFIRSTEEALLHPEAKDAILRFSHAETISPFATLLGIQQAAIPASSVYTYDQHWQASEVIPLSANIQWIVYSNGQAHLVKVLLNEREATLPFRTTTWPYYRWEDLKQYYEARLHELKVDLHQDMLQYLKDVR